MAAVPLASSYTAASLLTILIPICLLIGIGIWQVHAVMNVPHDPAETAAPAAGAAEVEGSRDRQEAPPQAGGASGRVSP